MAGEMTIAAKAIKRKGIEKMDESFIHSCAECRAQEFTLINDVIKDLGKFQSESILTYHAYHIVLDGGSDDTILGDNVIDRVGNSFIEESESGFVYGTHYDSDQEADTAWEALQNEFSAYPDDDFDG